MVSIRAPISNSSRPLSRPLVTVTKRANHDCYHCYSHHSTAFLVLWQGSSTCLTFRFLWFSLCGSRGQQNLQRFFWGFFLGFFFFLLIITWPGLLDKIRWSVCFSESQRILCDSFSRTDSSLCKYHLAVWSNFISCTIPSGSLSPLSRVYSYILLC